MSKGAPHPHIRSIARVGMREAGACSHSGCSTSGTVRVRGHDGRIRPLCEKHAARQCEQRSEVGA